MIERRRLKKNVAIFFQTILSSVLSRKIINFTFEGSNKSFTHFLLLCAEYISIAFSSNHNFIGLLQNSLPLSTHILFGLQLDPSKTF